MRESKNSDGERESLLEKQPGFYNNDKSQNNDASIQVSTPSLLDVHGDKQRNNQRRSGLERAQSSWTHWMSMLLWLWVNPIISLGYKQTLTDNDLDDLPHHDKCSTLLNRLLIYQWSTTTTWRIVMRAFWKESFFVGLIALFYIIARIAQPLLLREIIINLYREDDEQSQPMAGYIYAILLFLCILVHAIIHQQLFFHATRVGIRIRNALSSTIYRHLLLINQSSFQKINAAQTINLVANDVSRFEEFWDYAHFLWAAPLECIIVFIILCYIIGPLPTLFAYIMLLLLILIQTISSRRCGFYYQSTMISVEKRIKAFSEVINGCNIIKMYNWEEAIEKRIYQLRQQESVSIKRAGQLRAIHMAVLFVGPCLMSLVAFGGLWLLGYELIAANIFSALLFFNLIRLSFAGFLPIAIERLSVVLVASKRIDAFMQLETLQPQKRRSYMSTSEKDNNKESIIIMRDASFSWGDDNTCLSSLNIDIKAGQFVGIAGPVGAGKSSLLAAILGEMNQTNGNINVHGSLSYAAQSSSIFPDTIRANILLGKPMDMERYMRVLRACCLDVDFRALGEVGDLTMLGEHGVNLSGGQKARLTLARALYTDADIYLLDDPLSAVDATVAKKIYDACISSQGLLSGKTRLLVTHQIHFLIDADQTILLANGNIEAQGSFDQLSIQHRYVVQTKSTTTTDEKHDNASPVSLNELDLHKAVADSKSILADETSITGSVNWSVWYRLFTAPPLGWFGLCLLIVFLLINEAFSNASYICLAIWSEQLYKDQQSMDAFAYIYLTLVLCTLIAALIVANFWFYTMLCGANRLHNNMLKGILYTSMRFFESNPSGRILNRASRDQQIIDKLLPDALFDATQALLTALSAAIIIFLINPWTLLLFLLLMFIFGFVYRYYARTNHQLKRLESVSRSPIYTLFSSSLDGLMTIRAFKVKDNFIQTFVDRIDAHTRACIMMRGAIHWFGLRLDAMAAIFSLLVAVLSLVNPGKTNLSLRALSLMYSINMVDVFRWGATQLAEAATLMVSAERIDEYGQLPPEEDHGGQKGLIQTSTDWPIDGSIEIQNYTLRYRPELEPSLKNINFRIEPHEKVGIIGRTGAGKSSLFQAIFRLVDRSVIDGQILIDNIDINRITLNQLRSNLSVIPQLPVLFSATLRYNLDPFNYYSDEQCWTALEAVQLKHRIASHPDGLYLSVSESGSNFSAGECQLICVARAILKQCKILLIDEATANVDQTTDAMIQAVIRDKFRDRTILTIAHRLNTVTHSDRILVMEQGQVTNFDVPNNIITHLFSK